MLKKNLCAIFMALVICMVPNVVFATENNSTVDLESKAIFRWVGVSKCTNNFFISSDKANVAINLISLSGKADKVGFSVNLQQYNNNKWISIKNWSETKKISTKQAEFNNNFSVSKGYKYRFTGNIKVYNGNTLIDSIRVTSDEKNY